MKHTNPNYHKKRLSSSAKLLTMPIILDTNCQNEKLVMYGVCAVDGYSGKIVQFITMPVKNNLEIYEHLFR